MTAPRRRWSFGPRTLFVLVTVLGIALGWVVLQVMIVWERKSAEAWIEANGGEFLGKFDSRRRLSWIRELLGDQRFVGDIMLPSTVPDTRLAEIRRIFPECESIARDVDSPNVQADWP
jgi:hypothetical protein